MKFAAMLDDQLTELNRSVAGLPTDELEWQKHPGMNTIGMLLAHLAVVEVFWICVVAAGRNHKAESDIVIRNTIGIGENDDGLPLAANGMHPASLRGFALDDYARMLTDCRKATHRTLMGMTDDDLTAELVIDGQAISREWILYHVLEHLSGHLGQIRLIRHLMNLN
jgi:uncharacterized damage-inducible protein DinB